MMTPIAAASGTAIRRPTKPLERIAAFHPFAELRLRVLNDGD
jgi:hypothetical protein